MRPSTRDDYARRVLLAQQHVEANLLGPLDAVEVAQVAGMSPHHFHRVFRGMTGESVMGYARRLRLERAARRLATTDVPVLEVALGVGYDSHEGFTRAFTRAFDMSPSAWRAHDHRARPPAGCAAPVPRPAGVEIRATPAVHAVFMRHVGPYEGVPEAWERLHAWWAAHADRLGLPADSGAQPMYGVVPDDPSVTPAARLRYDAAIAVPRRIPRHELPEGPVGQLVIPAGTSAVLTWTGPYTELSDPYVSLLGGWFPDSGRIPAPDPVIEAYLNSPDRTPPDALRTEIRVRLARRWPSTR